MSTVAMRLRALANELDQGSNPVREGAALVPIRGDQVVAGDWVRPNSNSWLRAEVIEVVADQPAREGGPMLRIHGQRLRPEDGTSYESTHLAYSDEWVVVER